MRPEILFIGHGAERSGPPMLLANFQRWIAAHTDARFATMLARGGDLLPAYRGLGPTRVLDRRWTGPRIVQQALRRVGRDGSARRLEHLRGAATLRGWRRAPVAYVNTAAPATAGILSLLPDDTTVVLHVHEMAAGLAYRLSAEERRLLLDRADLVVAASQAVSDHLTRAYGFPTGRVRVHREFVTPVDALDDDERRTARQAAGIPPDAFVVGGSGMTEWRKAPDLFVHVAHRLQGRTDRPISFVWVGGADQGPEWWPLDHESRHLGVSDVVRFLGPRDDAGSWFRLLDAFAVTSREDAFPLSAVEAATAGVPVVAFDTGGMVELVDLSGGGEVVPYPDVDRFAQVLAALADDDGRRRDLGEAAAAYAREHLVTAVGAPALWAELDRLRAD